MKLNVDRIEELRKKAHLTKGELAVRVGYRHQSGYSNLLRKKHVPRDKILESLAEALGVPEKSLLI